MEYRAKFILGNRVAVWKSTLIANPNITTENADELESHLFDEIEALLGLGLNDEESFIIASRRLGSFEELSFEFSKVNQKVAYRRKFIEYLKGALIFIAMKISLDLIVNISVLITAYFEGNDSLTQFVAIGVRLMIIMLLGLGCYKLYNSKFNRPKFFTKISFLICATTIVVLLFQFSKVLLVQFLGPGNYAMLSYYTTIFNWLLMAFALVLAIVLFFWNKNRSKLVLSK